MWVALNELDFVHFISFRFFFLFSTGNSNKYILLLHFICYSLLLFLSIILVKVSWNIILNIVGVCLCVYSIYSTPWCTYPVYVVSLNSRKAKALKKIRNMKTVENRFPGAFNNNNFSTIFSAIHFPHQLNFS